GRAVYADRRCCLHFRSTAASSLFTAARFCSISELVYTSMLTPMPCPRWSEATFRSTPCLSDSVALAFRKTWNVAQPSPTFSSFGFITRRQRLSADSGVVSVSLGKTNPFGLGSSARFRHSFSNSDVRSEIAISRTLPFFGVSKTRLYTRCSTETAQRRTAFHRRARI